MPVLLKGSKKKLLDEVRLQYQESFILFVFSFLDHILYKRLNCPNVDLGVEGPNVYPVKNTLTWQVI